MCVVLVLVSDETINFVVGVVLQGYFGSWFVVRGSWFVCIFEYIQTNVTNKRDKQT